MKKRCQKVVKTQHCNWNYKKNFVAVVLFALFLSGSQYVEEHGTCPMLHREDVWVGGVEKISQSVRH